MDMVMCRKRRQLAEVRSLDGTLLSPLPFILPLSGTYVNADQSRECN